MSNKRTDGGFLSDFPARRWFAAKCQEQTLRGWHEFLTTSNGPVDARHSWTVPFTREGVNEAGESVACDLVLTENGAGGVFCARLDLIVLTEMTQGESLIHVNEKLKWLIGST